MIWTIVLLLGVTVGGHGDEEAVSEQRVTIHHPKTAPIISLAEDKQKDHKDYAWSYPSYEFSYNVKDPYTHDIKGQTEERDGDKVKGDYWLIEPTGRKRTVKYHADDEIGFNAHVDYTKSEYSHKEKEQNNQVESLRINTQEDKQLQEQKNGIGYEVTEGYNKDEQKNIAINNRENDNNDEKGDIENSDDQRGDNQEENIVRNQKEEIENNNNNENQEPISDAMVTLEALNDNIEPQDNCKCNERHQNDYEINKNEVKNNNNGQEMTSRKKRKNINRNNNLKNEGNRENSKQVELSKIDKYNNKKLDHSDEKKNNQNNFNDKRKKNDSANFGNRNGKRRHIQTHEKSQNNTLKIEEIKESEIINKNENNHQYQHRILIHHPKIVAANKKS